MKNEKIDINSLSIEDIDALKSKLSIQQNILLEQSLTSNDPDSIIKAQTYLERRNNISNNNQAKAFLLSPDNSFYNTNGFKEPMKAVSYQMLRRMARTNIPKIIINTRIDQIAGFADFTDNDQERGWTIKKKSLFKITSKNEDSNDKNIEIIAKFIMNGGKESAKWDSDGFEENLRSIARDSLELDQMCMECVYSVGKDIYSYHPVDSSTIRLIDEDSIETRPSQGYIPKYAQVWQGQVFTTFYPWEMSFGIRNKTTDIFNNGYGVSELEDMVQIVTYLLYGVQYNGNFFSQGSNPKGFFTIEGNLSANAINEFKQMWRNTISGVNNSHKVPVIEGGGKIQWIDMHHSNKDMEFGSWMDFLMTIACCTFKIDPSECGFNLTKGATMPFGQDGQKARLEHSQSKGLVPILKAIQRLFTKYIVEPLHPDYEFVFTGIEQEDLNSSLDLDVKKVQNGFMSMQEGFEKWSDREFNEKEDIILNPIYQQIQAQKAMGGSMYGDPQGVDEEDSDYYSEEDNEEVQDPFQKSLDTYVNNMQDRLKGN